MPLEYANSILLVRCSNSRMRDVEAFEVRAGCGAAGSKACNFPRQRKPDTGKKKRRSRTAAQKEF